MNERLRTELWTSWAALLRSYAAAHGLNSTQHAVVEVSANEITLRVGSRWLRFTPSTLEHSNAAPQIFALDEDGTIRLGPGPPEEMDLAAERLVREAMHSPH